MVDGDQHVWVTGMLNQLDGEKALVKLPKAKGKGISEILFILFLDF